MALDIPPPSQVLTHAHWTLGRQKMAKSTGNVVNPFFALDRFGVDAMRYYLAHDGGIRDDADYENAYITDRYRKGLYGGIGNLASRVTRGRTWNVRRAVQKATSGKPPARGTAAEVHRQLLIELPEKVAARFVDLDSGAALRAIMHVIYSVCFSTPSFTQVLLNHCIDKRLHASLSSLEPGQDRHRGPGRRGHLPVRRVAAHLRHPAPAVHAVEDEGTAGYAGSGGRCPRLRKYASWFRRGLWGCHGGFGEGP